MELSAKDQCEACSYWFSEGQNLTGVLAFALSRLALWHLDEKAYCYCAQMGLIKHHA